jgi:hypothetical protein
MAVTDGSVEPMVAKRFVQSPKLWHAQWCDGTPTLHMLEHNTWEAFLEAV